MLVLEWIYSIIANDEVASIKQADVSDLERRRKIHNSQLTALKVHVPNRTSSTHKRKRNVNAIGNTFKFFGKLKVRNNLNSSRNLQSCDDIQLAI